MPASSIDIYIHVQWNATLRRFKTWRSYATTLSILVSYVKIVKPKIVPGSTVKQHTDRENSMAPCRSVVTLAANWSDVSASWPANLSRKTDNASLAPLTQGHSLSHNTPPAPYHQDISGHLSELESPNRLLHLALSLQIDANCSWRLQWFSGCYIKPMDLKVVHFQPFHG